MANLASNYNISENNPLNLFLAVIIVAFAAHLGGRLIASVFNSAPAEAAVVQLTAVVFASRAVTQLLTKLKFHAEVVSYAKDVFGPFMWATQGAGLANATDLFSRIAPV